MTEVMAVNCWLGTFPWGAPRSVLFWSHFCPSLWMEKVLSVPLVQGFGFLSGLVRESQEADPSISG